jgi:hypothetical protein
VRGDYALGTILNKGNVYSHDLLRTKERIVETLRYHHLIPDGRIDMLRISDGNGYERLVDLDHAPTD